MTYTCEPCTNAKERAYFGLKAGTHCQGCHRTWAGMKEAHCTVCHAHFSTPNNFELHLGRRGCVPPATIVDKHENRRLMADDRGVWRSPPPARDAEAKTGFWRDK